MNIKTPIDYDWYEKRCARDFWIYKIFVWGTAITAGLYGIYQAFC